MKFGNQVSFVSILQMKKLASLKLVWGSLQTLWDN